MNSVLRNLAVWFVLGSLLIYVFNNIENSGVTEQISYSQFKEEVLSDRIAKVVYKGDQMTITGERLDGSRFETTHPIFKKDEAVDNAIQDNGIIAVYEKIEQPSIWSQLLVGAFPKRLFYVSDAIRAGWSLEKIHKLRFGSRLYSVEKKDLYLSSCSESFTL